MKTLKALSLLAAALLASDAMAFGESYYECDPSKPRLGVLNDAVQCLAPDTPRQASLILTDQHGNRRVKTVQNPLLVICDATETCKQATTGDYYGKADAGRYAIPWGYYLGFTVTGKPVAYKQGEGPEYGGREVNDR